MALSQKEQERETGPCQKSHKQRSQIHMKSPGVQLYSYQRKTEEIQALDLFLHAHLDLTMTDIRTGVRHGEGY